MKEKIATALKTKYAKLGLSQKAFDGVAAILEKTITDENAIESTIAEDYVADLLKGLQSEFDSLRTAKANADKALKDYKESHPDTTPSNPPQDDELSKKIKALEDKQAEYERKISDNEHKAKRESVIAELDNLLDKKGCSQPYIRKNVLKSMAVSDADTAESLLDSCKAQYDEEYKAAYSEGVIPPAGNNGPVEYEQVLYPKEAERLKSEGLM